jgi:hypothetical protein
MGFNVSQSKRRSAVLSGTLEEFAGWTLTILCPRCRHQRVLQVSDLLVLYRGDQKFGSLVKRLRCSRAGCASPPARFVIANRLHEVVLVGQGAF